MADYAHTTKVTTTEVWELRTPTNWVEVQKAFSGAEQQITSLGYSLADDSVWVTGLDETLEISWTHPQDYDERYSVRESIKLASLPTSIGQPLHWAVMACYACRNLVKVVPFVGESEAATRAWREKVDSHLEKAEADPAHTVKTVHWEALRAPSNT